MYKGLLRPSPFVLPYWSPGCMRRICFDVLQGHCMVIGVKSVRSSGRFRIKTLFLENEASIKNKNLG